MAILKPKVETRSDKTFLRTNCGGWPKGATSIASICWPHSRTVEEVVGHAPRMAGPGMKGNETQTFKAPG